MPNIFDFLDAIFGHVQRLDLLILIQVFDSLDAIFRQIQLGEIDELIKVFYFC